MAQRIPPFKLERYFARYEFKAPYLLSASDCEALPMSELLAMADEEARSLWEQLSLGYTESAGLPALRREIASLYRSLTPQDVLVLAPEEGIFIAMHVLLSPGDRVISVFPAYQSLLELASALGCEVLPWRFQAEKSGWQLDLDWLERTLDEKTRLLVINFPHNPTGYLPSLQEYQTILALARRVGAFVFSDEMYRMLEYDPARRLPPACDEYERAISLSGMSKTFALPGLRIGWLASRDSILLEQIQAYKDYTTICSSAPSEVLALIGLRSRLRLVARSMEIVHSNLLLAEDYFSGHENLFRWLSPQAGSVAFPEWIGPGSAEEFCERALQRAGVMIVPGSMFDDPGDHFRIGLGRRSFSEALERVKGIAGAI